jgi:hypothetical protein
LGWVKGLSFGRMMMNKDIFMIATTKIRVGQLESAFWWTDPKVEASVCLSSPYPREAPDLPARVIVFLSKLNHVRPSRLLCR